MAVKKRRSYRRRMAMWRNVCIALLACLTVMLIMSIGVCVDCSEVTIEVGDNQTDYLTPRVTLLGIDLSRFVKVKSDNVDTSQIGSYRVTYESWISFAHFFYKRVKVVDTVAPVITLEGGDVYVMNKDFYEEPGVTVTDNYDGDLITELSRKWTQVEDGVYRVDYYVMDSSGNTATATRMVYISKGVVYLTFDDGPSTTITPKILELLETKGVQATFFVLGFDEQGAELVKQESEAGHTVAMHGYSHVYSDIYQSVDTAMENFYILEELLKSTINGYATRIIRFPGGSSNTVSKNYCLGVMTELVQRATEEGYTYFDWNVDSDDAGSSKDDAEQIYQNVITALKVGGESVVLMHDGYGHEATYEALEAIIDYCQEDGYILKPITNQTTQVKHGVNN